MTGVTTGARDHELQSDAVSGKAVAVEGLRVHWKDDEVNPFPAEHIATEPTTPDQRMHLQEKCY